MVIAPPTTQTVRNGRGKNNGAQPTNTNRDHRSTLIRLWKNIHVGFEHCLPLHPLVIATLMSASSEPSSTLPVLAGDDVELAPAPTPMKNHNETCFTSVSAQRALPPACMVLSPDRQVHLAFHNVGKRIRLKTNTPGANADVSKRTKHLDLLQGVTGEAKVGQILAVMGPSGGGKVSRNLTILSSS